MRAEEIRAIRERADMSRLEFCRAYRIPVRTLQDWEMNKRSPDAAALALLTAIQRDHEIMRELLAEGGKDG